MAVAQLATTLLFIDLFNAIYKIQKSWTIKKCNRDYITP